MKLTTELLDNALGTAKGTSPNLGVLALLCLFARSHVDNANIFPELHGAYREARRRWVFLTTLVATVIGSFVLISFMSVKGLGPGHVIGVALAALMGCAMVSAASGLWSNVKVVEIETEGRPALEKLRRLAEALYESPRIQINICTIDRSSPANTDVSVFKQLAEKEARHLAESLKETESLLGDTDPKTEEVRHAVHQLLFLLSSSGLIEKNWKKAYLGTEGGVGEFHHSPSDY